MKLRNAFTLIELLVVIAILAILAALLFPVFAQARAKARQAACASNFKQQSLAIFLYQHDYDELMPLSYSGDGTDNSPPVTIIYQSLQPYLKNMQVYNCPSDPISDAQRATLYTPPPTTQQQREFNLALKNDFGFNWQYLSPSGERAESDWISVPTSVASIGSLSQTILAVDSEWNRDANGIPDAGGGAAVDPPCRQYSDGVDSFPAPNQFLLRSSWGGWQPSHPIWGGVYGFAWPWHGDFATVAFCDGHIKALTMNALAAGCDVQDGWGGYITDREKYLWDLQ